MEVNELWDKLVENDYFTEEELRLITNINGYTVDTLNDCIFARYGYRDYSQMTGEEDKQESPFEDGDKVRLIAIDDFDKSRGLVLDGVYTVWYADDDGTAQIGDGTHWGYVNNEQIVKVED